MGGITTESKYPYEAKTKKCNVTSDMFVLEVVDGSHNITEGDEIELKNAVAMWPVSIAYQVIDSFRDYKSGVYSSTECKNTTSDVNHAVLAVGYGREDNMDYWLVKNSWGTDFGDGGFFKIQRGVNMCGIAVCNSYPIDIRNIEKEGPQFLQ